MLTEEARNSLAIMFNVYGGKFSAQMTKKNTHLILPTAEGEKYQAALRWGVKVVAMAWVVESALMGELGVYKDDAWFSLSCPPMGGQDGRHGLGGDVCPHG